MWISPVSNGFVIKQMFGNHSDVVSPKIYKSIGDARGQLMRWHFGIEKQPVF